MPGSEDRRLTHIPGSGARAETREVLIAHDPESGPLTAVRNVIVQSSLAELKQHGHYEAYTKLMDPGVLEQLLFSLAPGWIPFDLAFAHYEACERLGLSDQHFAAMGRSVGGRVQETVLVSARKKAQEPGHDLMQSIGSLGRMFPRLFQGGSVQVVKVGPQALLYEERGFKLNCFNYYRQGHVAAVRAAHEALGVKIVELRALSYKAATDELVVRVEWQ